MLCGLFLVLWHRMAPQAAPPSLASKGANQLEFLSY